MYAKAFRIGLRRGIRTFTQTAGGSLAGVGVVSVRVHDLRALLLLLAAGGLTALVAGVAAFCQNFAEALPE
jgi:hypothetical protein